MNEKIQITTEPFDANHYIMFCSKDNKDIGFSLHISEFNKEMGYLLYDCKVKVVEGRTGFIFPNTIPIDEIIIETKRFISQYNLDK
ncbi:MAG: hypothetical protein IJJ76_07940 [Ruminococcus sp.]|uniref:hypothetical protein n=1 Tax=Ruminococcus sp. TaxID=41978 RepID=UPI0025CF153D|nr:hypothetical protein [Ruminococcus sp.]MBR0529676.1 hypothetical protein [Ruminococcus sp.]